jgi:hypothetical protein
MPRGYEQAKALLLLPVISQGCYLALVSTAEMILQKTSKLPDELQREALRFVDFLLAEHGKEQGDWTRFSSEQLASQYSPADAVYDQD